jgi:hypothetical protein
MNFSNTSRIVDLGMGIVFVKKLMLAGALLLAVTGLAQAADMPLKALPPPPAFTWTGIYAGAFVGGMWAKTDSDFVFPPPASWEHLEEFPAPPHLSSPAVLRSFVRHPAACQRNGCRRVFQRRMVSPDRIPG